MKTVLSVQDLSCVGRCSLTVALPVLSAMGCRCSVLPTAVLSTHTGFPDPHILSLTDHIGPISRHFETLGLSFDAVTTGYFSGPAPIDEVLPLVGGCKGQGSRIIVDPAMGDHGRLYRGLGDDHVAAMTRLCGQGDILLPNVTEAALLTGLSYREQGDPAYYRDLAQALLERFPAQAVLITGVTGKKGTIGFAGLDRETGLISYQVPVVPRQFHGTGDLFAAVFTGGLLSEQTLLQAGIQAADFVRACVAETKEVTPQGVEFEPLLHQFTTRSAHYE